MELWEVRSKSKEEQGDREGQKEREGDGQWEDLKGHGEWGDCLKDLSDDNWLLLKCSQVEWKDFCQHR